MPAAIKKRIIEVICDVKSRVRPDEMEPYQGTLKTLDEAHYEKLKASLLRHGFAFPVYAWKKGDTNFTLDGHQRVKAIELMAEEGIEVEGGRIPVVFVKAKSAKHAKELILAAMSQYGTYEAEDIYEFIKVSKLEWADVKQFADFSSLNMGTLEKGWFDSSYTPEEKAGGGGSGGGIKSITCPNCGHSFED